ncbi:MAG: hypothetical protein QY312_02140 [Candidatus Dojkabacteria bacterium]|nr:MAG: hypothetical protein QY312_02140 [Candidatus Dojkabacteria bacterium]
MNHVNYEAHSGYIPQQWYVNIIKENEEQIPIGAKMYFIRNNCPRLLIDSEFADRRACNQGGYEINYATGAINPLLDAITRALQDKFVAANYGRGLNNWGFKLKKEKKLYLLETRHDFRAFYSYKALRSGFTVFDFGEVLLARATKSSEEVILFLQRAKKEKLIGTTMMSLLVYKAFRKEQREKVLKELEINPMHAAEVFFVATEKGKSTYERRGSLRNLVNEFDGRVTKLDEYFLTSTEGTRTVSMEVVFPKLSYFMRRQIQKIQKKDFRDPQLDRLLELEVPEFRKKYYDLDPNMIFVVPPRLEVTFNRISFLPDDLVDAHGDLNSPVQTLQAFFTKIFERFHEKKRPTQDEIYAALQGAVSEKR